MLSVEGRRDGRDLGVVGWMRGPPLDPPLAPALPDPPRAPPEGGSGLLDGGIVGVIEGVMAGELRGAPQPGQKRLPAGISLAQDGQ
jgi:hypothetical protein